MQLSAASSQQERREEVSFHDNEAGTASKFHHHHTDHASAFDPSLHGDEPEVRNNLKMLLSVNKLSRSFPRTYFIHVTINSTFVYLYVN